MDAVEFLKERERMCENNDCDECELGIMNNGKGISCGEFSNNYPEKAVEVVEKWQKENES